MIRSDSYLKVVEWSEEDNCYVGRCPELMLGGVHRLDKAEVCRELCEVIEEWIEIDRLGQPPSS
jgi:predicted RNase H-like HicB family nuclease